jgi:hypothetical protein
VRLGAAPAARHRAALLHWHLARHGGRERQHTMTRDQWCIEFMIN